MSGSSLIFMIFSWITVVSFAVFCLTIILREGKKKKTLPSQRETLIKDEEEIT